MLICSSIQAFHASIRVAHSKTSITSNCAKDSVKI
jgi:hypothetical protein